MVVWIWTATASLGAMIAVWNTLDAWADLRALGSLSNGRRLIAVGWVRRELIRVFVQAVWAAIGFLALPTAGGPVSPIAFLLTATAVAVAANTVLDARDRLALRRILT